MINETKKNAVREETLPSGSHKNYMDGPSYNLSPFARLYVMAASSFLGEDGYYTYTDRRRDHVYPLSGYLDSVFGSFGEGMRGLSGKNRVDAMEQAVKESLEYDPGLTLAFLAWLRKNALMRATPAAGLAIASRSDAVRGSGMLRAVSGDVFSRLDDVTNCLAFYLDRYGKPVPNALKKIVAQRLSDATEYELAKYASKNRKVTLADAIRLSHAHSEGIDKFLAGELKLGADGPETWESLVSREGSTKEAWEKAVGLMGHMALLRNLRNLEKAGVDEALFLQKLVDGARDGKQLPFRYYSALSCVTSANIKAALEQCLDISVGNLPRFGGNTLVLADNSGSACTAKVSNMSKVSVATCGNLMGVLTGLVSENGRLGVFGDEVKYIPVHSGCKGTALGLLETANELGRTVGESTENGAWLALDEAVRSKAWYDRIFIYSDMQAGHGGLFGEEYRATPGYPVYPLDPDLALGIKYIDIPALVARYRREVNPDCKLYCVQIGGYSDNIIPEFYPGTCILAGWSPELLRFAAMFEENPAGVEDVFRQRLGIPKKQRSEI